MESITFIGIILVIILLISAVASVFVYKDAKKRSMNAVVWAIVAFFGPFLIGVIVYLINRAPLAELHCPKCGVSLSASANECPQCNSVLVAKCPECGFSVQKGWKACPQCGKNLPEAFEQPIRAYDKENGVGVILGIVAALFVLLCVVAVGFWGVNGLGSNVAASYGGFEGMYNIAREDIEDNDAIAAWISSSEGLDEDVYILLSESSKTCLVYVKDSEKLMSSYIDLDYYYGECTACIRIEETEYEDSYGYDFFLYEFEIYDDTEVDVWLNGTKQDVKVTYTDADISMDAWEVK